MRLTLGQRTLDLTVPRVMGVLNVTPDSFSDGGRFFRRDQALRHAVQMHADGADIIDIGGESTRPGAAAVPLAEELERVVPLIEAVVRETGALVSVDTGKPAVMAAAVAAGAVLINDVFALRKDGALETAAGLEAAVCVMHMQGLPRTMQQSPVYDAIPGDIVGFLRERVAACEAAGIVRERLLIDPGFGFGKTDEHNLTLLYRLAGLRELGLPVVVGLSRKRTLGHLTGREPLERTAAGLAAAVLALERGAHIVRTHDVAATADACKVVSAMRAAAGGTPLTTGSA